ncbi:MAG: GDP-mannose 4,6-dehydratase, partial [Thaumarchaeota archaeon]|nr:GDP-mannose 4,6-dehydratase [Nitrososphaerota archaeon]
SILNLYKADEVYNLAAQSHVAVSFEQPLYTWQVTAGGALNVLDVLHKLQTTEYRPRFYQASSSEMFGDRYDFIGDHRFQDEDTAMNPCSPYGIAKLAAHHATKVYRTSYAMYACSGILMNHESPRRGENFVTRKITSGIANIAAKKQEKIFLGNIKAKRDWGFAGDYVKAMWLMLQQDTPSDYIIATGQSHSVESFLEKAFDYSGLGNWKDFVEISPKYIRPIDIDDLVGDATKAKTELNWEPEMPFEKLVKLMVDSDMSNVKKM